MNTVGAGLIGALVLEPNNVDICAPITRSAIATTSATSGAISSERRDGCITLVDMTPPFPEETVAPPFEVDARERPASGNRPHGYV